MGGGASFDASFAGHCPSLKTLDMVFWFLYGFSAPQILQLRSKLLMGLQ